MIALVKVSNTGASRWGEYQRKLTHDPRPVSAISRQSGVALGIVLWFLAGMSLLVAGIVSQARVDTHMAQLHVARAIAVSAGDGAILRMLADLVSLDARTFPKNGVPPREYTVGTHTVTVEVIPNSGLLNLNSIPASTLAQLLTTQGGMTGTEAKTLADNVIKWRTNAGLQRGSRGPRQFQSVEDLLQVGGFTRAVWDALRDSVMVSEDSSGALDLASAPAPLRAAVSEGLGARQPDKNGRTPQKKSGRGKPDNSFRLDAVVHYGGRSWLRRKWVSLSGKVAGKRLPWDVTRVEAPRVLRVE